MKTRHFVAVGALLAVLATWLVAQAPVPGNTFGGAAGLGANTFSGAQNATTFGAGAFFATSGLAAIYFSQRVTNDLCLAAIDSNSKMCVDATGSRLGSGLMAGWSSAADPHSAVNDTGIERVSAGVIGINNGTTNSGGGLKIPGLKSTTGTRYLCIDTAGLISSSASACSGT